MSDTVLRNADINAALAEAKEAYVARNPRSLARYVEATTVMPGGNTRTVLHYNPFPVAMVRAEGCRMWDADSAEYVDFLGEYTAGLYGHSHPLIRAAVDQALDNGISFGASNMTEARFARAVCDRFGLERVRFTNSGTEANLLAISTAVAATGRRKVMVMRGGYHGAVFTFSPGVNINAPFDYIYGTYNDVEATQAELDANGNDLAAVILEPMLGGGGCISAELPFLKMLRERTEKYGAVLIFDEVMTSRLSPGGLQALVGVTPDITTLGKYVGGGMSFGAFGGKASLLSRYDPRSPDALPHAGTFNNNVLTMSAGIAALTEVYTPEAANALNASGDALRNRLNAIAEKHGVALQFTGRGSMLAVHTIRGPIRSPADAAKSNAKAKELYFFDLLKSRFWIARRGMMVLSVPLTPDDLDGFAGAVEEFISSREHLLH